jgi:hypothetical protein
VVVGSVAHESAGFYEALERIDDGNVKLARSLGNRIAEVEESTRQADDQDIRVIRPELRKSCLDTLTVVDRGSPFTLKVDATARDNQSTQDNEKHNRGDYRTPIIFGTPWVGPPTVVHIRAKRLIAHKQNVLSPCRVP